MAEQPSQKNQNKEAQLPAGSDLDALFFLLNKSTGVDFAHYKHTTLQRRIRRRMILHKFEKLKDYVRYVKKTPGELDQLYREILIHVTGFFREPEAFEALRKYVYPDLIGGREPDSPIRIWVPGCSTGEEVYSIAITLLEYMWVQKRDTSQARTNIQIFATDISEGALERARNGLYPETAMADVSPERLKRFFVHLDGLYQINRSIRDMCVFAEQNITRDPPFSNLDLISCRNLLIYLGPVLQRRVIPTLHYALKPSGFLMLGAAESVGNFAEYFTLVDKKNKVLHTKRPSTRLAPYFGNVDYASRRGDAAGPSKEEIPRVTIEKAVQQLLVDRFVPASIVVNDEMEIVRFQGRTGAYLEPASGHPTFSLSKMARDGLLMDLRVALSVAKRTNETVRKEGVRVGFGAETRQVNLEVVPIRGNIPSENFYLVVFQDQPQPASPKKTERGRKAAQPDGPLGRENERLNRELGQLQEQWRLLTEEHETTTEEFKAANEEVLSANEELQSTNEELETAKEELQSSNQELTTLNEEMQNRNAELTLANNDLLNLFGNVSFPVVMVSNDLRVRRFTPPAQKLLNLLPSDIGRRLSEIRPNLEMQDLGQIARASIENLNTQEVELRATDGGTWYSMRMRPYRTWNDKIDGAVISFSDIDAIKRNLDQARLYAETLIENAHEPILVLDGNLCVLSANQAFYREFAVPREDTEGRAVYELGNRQWDIPKLRELLETVMPNNERVEHFEVRYDFPHIGPRVMMLNARRVEPQPGRQMILLYIGDVTRQPAVSAPPPGA